MTLNELQLLERNVESICGQLQLSLDLGKDIKADLPILIAVQSPEDTGRIGNYIKFEMEHVNRDFMSRYKYRVRWSLYMITNNFSTNDPEAENERCISHGYSTTFLNESNIRKILYGITLKIRDVAIYGRKQIDGTLPGVNGRDTTQMDYVTPLWQYAKPNIQ